MVYIVRVVLRDCYTDSNDASESRFFGPYRSRAVAERIAASVEKSLRAKLEDADAVAVVEAVEKAGVRAIVRGFSESPT